MYNRDSRHRPDAVNNKQDSVLLLLLLLLSNLPAALALAHV
jgi:hypothetical protein